MRFDLSISSLSPLPLSLASPWNMQPVYLQMAVPRQRTPNCPTLPPLKGAGVMVKEAAGSLDGSPMRLASRAMPELAEVGETCPTTRGAQRPLSARLGSCCRKNTFQVGHGTLMKTPGASPLWDRGGGGEWALGLKDTCQDRSSLLEDTWAPRG